MAKPQYRSNTRSDYTSVPVHRTLHAECELAARERRQHPNEFVSEALQESLRRHTAEMRQSLYIEACERAKENRMPTPRREEFYLLNGWT